MFVITDNCTVNVSKVTSIGIKSQFIAPMLFDYMVTAYKGRSSRIIGYFHEESEARRFYSAIVDGITSKAAFVDLRTE